MEKVLLYKINKKSLLREESDLFGLLPEWRKEKVLAYKVESGRLQSLVAGRLLDMALADYLVLNVSEIDWTDTLSNDSSYNNERITTYLDVSTGEMTYFNISHSGDYVVVAVSETPVGVDVEVKDDKDFKVTKRMLAEEDKMYILNPRLSEEMKQMHFRDIWTVKESFLKCTGEGITVPLKSFTSKLYSPLVVKGDNVISDSGVLWEIEPLEYDMKENNYYVGTTRLDNGICSLSLCSSNPNLTLDIKRVEVLR